jgi:hypothetical protein
MWIGDIDILIVVYHGDDLQQFGYGALAATHPQVGKWNKNVPRVDVLVESSRVTWCHMHLYEYL